MNLPNYTLSLRTTLRLLGIATNGSTLPFRIRPGASSNSLVMDNDDDVGIGTLSPEKALHIRRSSGRPQLLENSATGGETWQLGHRDLNENFAITRIGSGQTELELTTGGNLTISGNLVTGGGGTCDPGPCDRTFSPDYEVESIEEHAAYMWEKQHLWGVGPTPEGAPINLSKKTTGILHELEKAHIYIEQFHNRLKRKDGQMQEVLDQVQALGAQNAALHERLRSLEQAQQ